MLPDAGDGANRIAREFYDNGSLASITPPYLASKEGARPTTYTYDRENRVTSATTAKETTSYKYDEVGNPSALRKPRFQPNGLATSYVHDSHNRLIGVTDEAGITTRYEYDKNDNLTAHCQVGSISASCDGSSVDRVAFKYDALDRRTQHIQFAENNAQIITEFLEYDAEGNLKKLKDPNQKIFSYDYDSLNRRTNAFYPSSSNPYLRPVKTQFEYDPNGNLEHTTETKQDPLNATAIEDRIDRRYDAFDRLDDSTQTRGATAGFLIDYRYDANGNRQSVAAPNGRSTSYRYDARNRLKTADYDGKSASYNYFPDGRLQSATLPNGIETVHTYTESARVESITQRKAQDPTQVISKYTYAYDANGNRSSQTELQDGKTETTAYTYDNIDRLKTYAITGAGATEEGAYRYLNEEGAPDRGKRNRYNRHTELIKRNGVIVKDRAYHYDPLNRVTSIDERAFGKQSVINYAYDKNGNTLSKTVSNNPAESAEYFYNSRDQMVQATCGPPSTQNAPILGQYDYNAGGQRVRHHLSDRGNVDYYYDEGSVIEERDGVSGELKAFYRYAEQLLSLATPADGEQFYHQDALGSTVNLTDSSGNKAVSYKTDPWGQVREQSGTSVNRKSFTGQERDEKTGLLYYGARYYDADIGRFTSQDSYLGQGGVPPSLNRYAYAYSNPGRFVDPTGHAPADASQAWREYSTNDIGDENVCDQSGDCQGTGR